WSLVRKERNSSRNATKIRHSDSFPYNQRDKLNVHGSARIQPGTLKVPGLELLPGTFTYLNDVALAAHPLNGLRHGFGVLGCVRKHAAAPARAVDFSAQCARVQGGLDHAVDLGRGGTFVVAEVEVV